MVLNSLKKLSKSLTILALITLSVFVSNPGAVHAVATTNVPDDVFEQKLIDLGYDSGPLNDYVPT